MNKPLYQQFKNAVFHIHPRLAEAEWQYLQSACTMKEFKKGDHFLKEGETQTAIGFVNSGLLRGYYIDKEGEEITIRFVKENGYATHYAALINQLPSRYYFQCLEHSQIMLLPLTKIQEGYEKFKGLERFGRLIAEQVLTFQQSRIEDFQFLDAEQRYVKFIEEYLELFNRISVSHLSSYLGIKRQSLTRIRSKIAKM